MVAPGLLRSLDLGLLRTLDLGLTPGLMSSLGLGLAPGLLRSLDLGLLPGLPYPDRLLLPVSIPISVKVLLRGEGLRLGGYRCGPEK